MTFKELFGQKEFLAIFNEVEQFTTKQLCSYNNKLEKTKLTDGSKEIFDAVWGNIEFSAGEVYILDAPLLQRLRRIKQLGFADLVYCGCDYSRFYHTIGVVYLADRMSTAINKCELGLDDNKKTYYKAVVRLAAIFHDVGHMFFSHVSEHYFSKSCKYPRNQEIKIMLDKFERESGKHIALHELLSCMIVNTSEVARLLKIVSKRIPHIFIEEDEDIEKLTEYISCLISGVPIDSNILPYATIVNGSIDADKCDYLSRDSHVTRVPVAVDISRITQKLSVVRSDKINKSNLWRIETGRNIQYYELAMQDSAEKALFQLCIARTIMFDSVYYHHKVLTAETEFRNILNELTHLENPMFLTFDEILDYTDSDFSRNTFELIKLNVQESVSDVEKLDLTYERLEKLYNRELAKRLVCILPEHLAGSQKEKEFLYDEVLTHIDAEGAEQLIHKVNKEYEYVCTVVGKENPMGTNIYIIQAPTSAFGHSKIQVPIDLYNGTQREFKGNNMVSSKETSSAASYIVSNAENKVLMYLAIEKVLYRDYSVTIKNEGYACGKYKADEVLKYVTKLFEKGYYDDAPSLIRAELVENHISAREIETLVQKYAVYEGKKGYKITTDEIVNFMKQFLAFLENKSMCKDVLRGVYKLLEEAIFIDRKYFFDCMDCKIKEVDLESKIMHMIPLGGSRDSGKHYAYYWNDILDQDINLEKDLANLAEDPTVAEIIFFDDGSFSGVQLLSILQEYMGIEERETDERHVTPLTEVQCEAWKKKKTIFLFIAFNKNNEEELRKKIVELGLSDFQFAYVEDLSKKCFDNDGKIQWESTQQRETTKNILSKIGYEVIKCAKTIDGELKDNWTEKRVQEAALGYNDAQQMVILKSSVPTYTISAFWQDGMVNGWRWNPLFKRTHKPS